MKFSYKARTAAGTIIAGVIDANGQGEAIGLLRETGLLPIVIKKQIVPSLSFNMSSVFKHVKLSEKIILMKNLSGMLRAGLSISRALVVLQKQTPNMYFKKVIGGLLETIDKGGTLSEGFARYPVIFSPLVVAMVHAGEESGSLPKSLAEIEVQLAKSYELRRKVKSAMMYPSIILGAIFIIGILMFIFVVPTLTNTFKELGVELPASTKFVVGLSDLISNHVGLLVGGIIVVVGMIILLAKVKTVRRAWDFISVRIPVLGTLLQEVNAARLTRTLSSLLGSGVTIDKSITISKDVLQNSYYRDSLDELMVVVQRGEMLSSVFEKYPKLYPIMVAEMVEVGEETGKLSQMLLDVALFYEGEVDAKTKDLSTIIEPVLMIFIGVAVGFFAVSMLSPMYSIMDSIN